MKQIRILGLLLLLISANGLAQTRTKVNFGFDWRFKNRDANPWQTVNLPHTAHIEKLVPVEQFQGICNYEKKFNMKRDPSKKYFLYFEGVMMQAEVMVNGQKALKHKGGYLPFTVDATPYLKPSGENTVSLKVTNTDDPEIPPGKPIKELDFNYYGGIYRNVYLITTNKIYITNPVAADQKAKGGLFLNFDEATKDHASGTVQVGFKNESGTTKEVHFKATLTLGSQRIESISKPVSVGPNSNLTQIESIAVDHPKLWSPEHPDLYNLKVELIADGQTVDEQQIRVGIRKAQLKPDGFYLNGEKRFLSGTNRHQEYPYLGYAISDEAQWRDAVKIKKAGFDFVRLSHYPQAEAFLDACDALGIVVMNSLPGWQFFGNAAFEANSLQNLRDMVRRDRNHAAILFWENSLNETSMSEAFMQQANVVLKEEFPYQTISASWTDNALYDLFIPARQHGKAPDYWNTYENNSRKILIAEYGDWEYYAQNAGFNQKAFANLKEEERTSRQLRGFGEKRLLQQAFNFQEAANSNRKGKNTIGQANWLMFDYNRGYSPDIESSGIADIFRIPKWAYDFYKSQNTPKPMAVIATSWTAKSPLDVTVYSNCEAIGLYLNGKLIEKKKPEINETNDALAHPPFVFHFDKFTAGTLKAEGFTGGRKVTENAVTSPKSPAKIKLSYDLSGIKINKNTPDVIFVYAKITDKNGTLVPDATDAVTFQLDGQNAELIGQNPMQAEAGIATILLRTSTFKKPLKISATAGKLNPVTLEIK